MTTTSKKLIRDELRLIIDKLSDIKYTMLQLRIKANDGAQ